MSLVIEGETMKALEPYSGDWAAYWELGKPQGAFDPVELFVVFHRAPEDLIAKLRQECIDAKIPRFEIHNVSYSRAKPMIR